MEHYLAIYQQNPLFAHVPKDELIPLLNCLHAEKHSYKRGDVIFHEGEPATRLGLVLSGRVNKVYDDVFGGRSILDSMEAGRLFCDACSTLQLSRLPIGVIAQEDCDVLLMDCNRVLAPCEKSCVKHMALVLNMLHILAGKYFGLNQKVVFLSHRTTRRKLLAYLSQQAILAGSNRFTIPFNRQELADYLFVDRSALCAELSKLRREGLVEYQRGDFTLKGNLAIR